MKRLACVVVLTLVQGCQSAKTFYRDNLNREEKSTYVQTECEIRERNLTKLWKQSAYKCKPGGIAIEPSVERVIKSKSSEAVVPEISSGS